MQAHDCAILSQQCSGRRSPSTGQECGLRGQPVWRNQYRTYAPWQAHPRTVWLERLPGAVDTPPIGNYYPTVNSKPPAHISRKPRGVWISPEFGNIEGTTTPGNEIPAKHFLKARPLLEAGLIPRRHNGARKWPMSHKITPAVVLNVPCPLFKARLRDDRQLKVPDRIS